MTCHVQHSFSPINVLTCFQWIFGRRIRSTDLVTSRHEYQRPVSETISTKSGDPIRLVCELYKVFKEETQSQETLDDFYFWGELLISDFDDVDKNMVDADKLFSNLQDLKNLMDDYEFLDKEQEEAIQQFFRISPLKDEPNSKRNLFPFGTN